jgi:hypothetical protein
MLLLFYNWRKMGFLLKVSIKPGRRPVNVVDFETFEMLTESTKCTKRQDVF